MRTLLEDGIMKALKGMTTLDEVLSTCHAEVSVTGGRPEPERVRGRLSSVDCDPALSDAVGFQRPGRYRS